jgi:surfeit locus 1 family protein
VADRVSAPPSRIGRIAMLAALAVTFLILIGLGTWQVERLQWKEALIASIEARRTAPPIDLAEVSARLARREDIDYQATTASGRFVHTGERYFLATHDGAPGYYVYTPLLLADGVSVFVNRGFVPGSLRDPASRAEGQVEGEVSLTGLARAKLSEKPSSLVPDNDIQANLFFWKDLDAMAAAAGLKPGQVLPFFIDADATPNPGGYPIGSVTQIDLPNSHLSYAVTWYGLAAVLLVVAVLAFRRRAR